MLREGHAGIAMISYAPFAFYFVLVGEPILAVLGGVFTIGGSGLPDVDTQLDVLKHRGWTHTLWFAGLCSVVGVTSLGVAVQFVPTQFFTYLSPMKFALSGGFLGVGVITHLFGDVITPAGIKPLHPITPRNFIPVTVSQRKYTLDLFKASNSIANASLFGLGIIATAYIVYFTFTHGV